MKKPHLAIVLLVIVFLLSIAGSVLAALNVAVPGMVILRGDIAVKDGVFETTSAADEEWVLFDDITITSCSDDALDTDNHNELNKSAACRQIVVNPQLDVIELGPGTGTAEPWFFLEPIIYFFEEGDGSDLAYDGYSLLLPDGDEGDPSPNSDILSQIVTFDNNLNSVTVAYQRVMIDSNPGDKVFGEFWLLTEDGDIDLSKPGTYRVTSWQVTDSEGTWSEEVVELDKAVVADLSGKEIALLMRTETTSGNAVYLPVVLSK